MKVVWGEKEEMIIITMLHNRQSAVLFEDARKYRLLAGDCAAQVLEQ